jgi:uncharacterized protein (TIGR03437 family)
LRYAISLFLFLPLFAARVETARLAPTASVWFEPNAGQVKGRTEFVGRTRGAFLYMTGREVVYAMAPARIEPAAKMRQVRMEFAGGALTPAGTGEEPAAGYSNYFVGKTEKEWFTGVPHYAKLRYRELYPGIDIVYYSANGAIEFDFIVHPGADISQIGMRFHGATSVAVGDDIIVKADGAEMRVRRPRVLQGGIEIPSWYEMENGVIKVRMARIDPSEALTIDPILDFSTYLGGPGTDSLDRMEMAADGNLILAGFTQSPASPALDPFQQPSIVSLAPILLKMSSDGRRILFYTILGRNGWDQAFALGIGKDGAITIGGRTRSPNFPLKNAFQSEFKAIWDNAFFTRLTGDGRALTYSSYLGGSNTDGIVDLALDDLGNAYFVGSTQSTDFPLVNALQSRTVDNTSCTLTRVSPDGKLFFSTIFGGAGLDRFQSVKWRSDGVLVIAGSTTSPDFPLKDPIQTTVSANIGYENVTLTMISDDGSQLLYSTYFGGPAWAYTTNLVLDKEGRIYILGYGAGRGFPVRNPLFADAEGYHGSLTIFDRTGKQRLYGTLLPGAWPWGLAVDEDGSVYISGSTVSSDFPLKDSLQPLRGGGVTNSDGFLMKISPDGGALLFSSLMGGASSELQIGLVLAPNKVLYASGRTSSTDFPVKNAYQGQSGGGGDAVLYRITDNSVFQSLPFTVAPGRLTFRYVQGEPLPPAAPVAIGGLTGQISATPSVPWLRVTPASLGVSGTLSVIADPAELAPGVYQGSVRLTPTSGPAASVDVTLTVLAPGPLLLSVDPAIVTIGTDDTEITLRGSGFTTRTTVQLQTVLWQLTPIRFIDSTALKFTLPKTYFSAEFNHSITVQNPDSAISKAVSLAVGRPAPTIAPKGIVSSASYAGDVLSPGEILTVFGENFEPGMKVDFDGLLATPLYITPTQMSVVAPAGLAGAREVNVTVQMNFEWRSVPVRMPVWPARPGLFTANGSGKGQAAALNENDSVNSTANPAAKGAIIVLWGTGGGVESLPQKVFMDGIDCEVLYAAGKDGLWQLNVRIPEFASKGEVVWRAGERESVEGVSVALRE